MITARALPWQCWNAPCPPPIPTGTEAPQGARGILPLLDTAGDVTVHDVEVRMVRTAGMFVRGQLRLHRIRECRGVCAGRTGRSSSLHSPFRSHACGSEHFRLQKQQTGPVLSQEIPQCLLPGECPPAQPCPAPPQRSPRCPGTGEATRGPSRVSNTSRSRAWPRHLLQPPREASLPSARHKSITELTCRDLRAPGRCPPGARQP